MLQFFCLLKKKKIINNIYFSLIFNDYLLLNFIKTNFLKLNWYDINVSYLNHVSNDFRRNYYLDEKCLELKEDNNFLVMGGNLRNELSLFNIKIKEKIEYDFALFYLIGFITITSFFYLHDGNNELHILKIFYKQLLLNKTDNFSVLFSNSFYKICEYFDKIVSFFYGFKEKFNVFNTFCTSNLELLLNEIG